MKTNEAVFRSPKWLGDWEIATGKDLKAKREAERKRKEYEAKLKREAEERQRRREEEQRRWEEDNRRREEAKKRKEEEFDELWRSTIQFIYKNYKSCYLSVPQHNYLTMELDGLSIDGIKFEFVITLNNRMKMPNFDVYIKHGDKEFSYNVTGLNYVDFKLFILKNIYEFYKSGNAKEKPKDSGGDYYGGKKEEPKTARRAERPNQQTERDPRANRLRRLALLRQTLEGYEATLARTRRGTRDYETLQNEIETIKGRIRAMERATNEGFNHVMSFQLFEKQFNPNAGDYVMITYVLTGEPVPVKIEKVYPNNTYLVSFNVEGSTAKGAPNQTIKNSDIIAPYKPIRSPVGTGYISANTNMSIRQVHQVSNDMYL